LILRQDRPDSIDPIHKEKDQPMPFNLGKILATPAAIAYLTSHDASPQELISRHINGD
jgi:hypothetical protein